MSLNNVDLIGDIHGQANELHDLLGKLGYTEVEGVYRHPERTVVFLGDFIDRGPFQMEVLRIAKGMCDFGSAKAIMGNHEFNAIGWVTTNKDNQFLRSHGKKENFEQHKEFLRQIGENSSAHHEAIAWFRTLPVLIDNPSFRAVHACWHHKSITVLQKTCLDQANCFTDDGFQIAHNKNTLANDAMEVVLKGPEKRLPDGMSFHDKSGHLRREARIKWWDKDATTFRSAALGMEGRESELPDFIFEHDYRYDDPVPVFFGHYWLKGEPVVEANNAVCLDYSVAKDGYLTAYQLNGERLNSDNLKFTRAKNNTQ